MNKKQVKRRTRAQEIWHRLLQNKGAVIGMIFLTVLVLAAALSPVIFDYETDVIGQNISERLMHPCKAHPFGTDEMGRDLLAASPLPIIGTLEDLPDAPSAEEAGRLAGTLKERYLSGQADEIILLYERYVSALRQEPCAKKLLPLEAPCGDTEEKEIIFEPDGKSLIDNLVELYLDNTVRAVVLEAKTGEHSARMTAMTAASDNTEQLLAKLNLELNHARQGAITTEISEIVGGANALQSSEEGKRG